MPDMPYVVCLADCRAVVIGTVIHHDQLGIRVFGCQRRQQFFQGRRFILGGDDDAEMVFHGVGAVSDAGSRAFSSAAEVISPSWRAFSSTNVAWVIWPSPSRTLAICIA